MKLTLRTLAGPLGLVGAALLVFAARSREIARHAGDVPFLDQWKIEAAEILEPWLKGTLSFADFFLPHHEHLPVWTRLLAWLETAFTGQWDPRVQMLVNALLHAGFVALVLRWLWSALGTGAALAASALLLATALLPSAWENITWGFQSQFPLALLFLFLHVHGTLTYPPRSARWWWAQGAAVAGLGTLGGMWTAPLAVVFVLAWTSAGRRTWLAPLLVAGAGLGLMAWLGARADVGPIAGLHAPDLRSFLYAWCTQLGWPAGTVLLNLPLVALALQLRGRRDAAAFDRIVLALGVWSVLQTAAIGYARGNGYVGYVSRYGELFAVGLLANFLATLRLAWPAGWPRALPVVGALAWLVVAGAGLFTLNTTGHTHYFHQHSAEVNALRRAAVLGYVRDGNPAHLTREPVREALYGNAGEVARLLAQPAVRDLMPAINGPAAAGRFTRRLQDNWAWLAGAALGALGVAATGLRVRPATTPPVPALSVDPWRNRLLAGLALASGAALFLWPHPLLFGETARKQKILQAPGTIVPLKYTFVGPAPSSLERMVGAAAVEPGDLRNIFRGTHISGPEDRAQLRSEPFVLVTPRLIVPFAGHPTTPGVTLQVVAEDDQGRPIHVYTCAETAPADVNFWEFDATAHQGRPARLVLDDQSGEPRAWIAVASPQYAWKPGQGALRRSQWAAEQSAFAHQSLGWAALLATGALAGSVLRRRLAAAKIAKANGG